MDTIETSAAILMIVSAATIFAWILTSEQVATILGDSLLGLTDNRILLLLIIMVMVLAIGLFMETIAAITILVPVLLPLSAQVGIDPVHLGIIVILNLMLGLLTPNSWLVASTIVPGRNSMSRCSASGVMPRSSPGSANQSRLPP